MKTMIFLFSICLIGFAVGFMFADFWDRQKRVVCLEKIAGDVADCEGGLPMYGVGLQEYEEMILPR